MYILRKTSNSRRNYHKTHIQSICSSNHTIWCNQYRQKRRFYVSLAMSVISDNSDRPFTYWGCTTDTQVSGQICFIASVSNYLRSRLCHASATAMTLSVHVTHPSTRTNVATLHTSHAHTQTQPYNQTSIRSHRVIWSLWPCNETRGTLAGWISWNLSTFAARSDLILLGDICKNYVQTQTSWYVYYRGISQNVNER